jgi:hypothetical protein
MPRPAFDALKGLPQRLYRGVNSPTDQEIFTKLGVGPVWHVVKALRDDSAIVLSDGALNSLPSGERREQRSPHPMTADLAAEPTEPRTTSPEDTVTIRAVPPQPKRGLARTSGLDREHAADSRAFGDG